MNSSLIWFRRLAPGLAAALCFTSTAAWAHSCNEVFPTSLTRRGFLGGVLAAPLVQPARSSLAADSPQMTTIYKGDRDSLVFVDRARTDEILLVQKGSLIHLTPSNEVTSNLISVDPRCSASALKQSLFVDPYFVSLGATCRLTPDARIEFVSSPTNPENAFSLTYFDQDQNFVYFLLNGKPDFSDGYIHVRKIDRITHQVTDSALLEGVPGFSGGMWSDGKTLYVSTVDPLLSHRIYTLDQDLLRSAIQSQQPIYFLNVAKPTNGPFPGLSLSLFATDQNFLLYNGELGAYTISRASGLKTVLTLPPYCEVVGLWQSQWLALCGSRELRAIASK